MVMVLMTGRVRRCSSCRPPLIPLGAITALAAHPQTVAAADTPQAARHCHGLVTGRRVKFGFFLEKISNKLKFTPLIY